MNQKKHLSWLGLVFLLVFFLYFYTQELPNNRPLTRMDLWETLPDIYLVKLILPYYEAKPTPNGWYFLPQRFPMIGVGIFLLLGSWAIGRLALRGVNRLQPTPMTLTRLESEVISITLGLCLWSLITLGLGLAGMLSQVLMILLLMLSMAAEFVVLGGWKNLIPASSGNEEIISTTKLAILLTLAAFVGVTFLGSLLPEADFDVKEYHIQGPKEFYQNGVITMLPHNVYTSFPFLTEMLTLSSMVIYGDWYWGALAGKFVLASFSIWTGLAVFAIANRLFGNFAGWMGLLIYLTAPWTYRISIIAYTEGGLSCYVAATLLMAVVTTMNRFKGLDCTREALLTGLLAGAAVSCKYPGMVQVVIPMGMWMLVVALLSHLFPTDSTSLEATDSSPPESAAMPTTNIRSGVMIVTAYILGTLITFGPWMTKNLVETGNPVYPLLYSVFGGVDWSPELDQKWKDAHYPHSHTVGSFLFFLKDIPFVNDWQSVLVYGFAMLTLPFVVRSVATRWMWIYLGVLFLAWWGLTHRLDRFWVPMQPIACVLAGASFSFMSQGERWRYLPFMIAGLVFNLGFIASGLSGDNSYLFDLTKMRESSGKLTAPEVMAVNELTKGNVLCVGEAEVFDATFRPIYNTVFDRSIFEDWTSREEDSTLPSADKQMKDTASIQKIFHDNKIEFILVNWAEILRYRTSYRYTDYVTPKRFEHLVAGGVLKPALPGYPFFRPLDSFNQTEREEIAKWAPELVVTYDGKPYFMTAQIFPVTTAP
ncbi:ArnT family glycosyltransferase [Lacunimicrobium album]